MILSIHMLFGAAIGYLVPHPVAAVALAFFGHYFLDLFPHVEYSIDHIRDKHWRKFLPDMAKVMIDFSLGILAILVFSQNQPIIYVCGLAALVPDGLTIISSLFPNRLMAWHDMVHTRKIHYFKYKKISNVWRIATQSAAMIASIIVLAS